MIPDIPGTKITDRQQLRSLKEHVIRLLEGTHSPNKFPGAQPVSFSSRHIQDLKQENYFCSEKADGVRILIFTTVRNEQREMYLIDRKNDYYFLQLGMIGPKGIYLSDTVLDAELVYEQHTKGQEMHLLLFDCMAISGLNLAPRPYSKRLGYLREQVCQPYFDRARSDKKFVQRYPFKMSLKRLESSYNLPRVFEQMQTYKHKTDGIIFTAEMAPYEAGTCEKILKWKPAEENTVDFKILKVADKYHLGIWIRDEEHDDYGPFELEDELKEAWRQSDVIGKIIECRYDPEWPNHWRFSRFRDDKATANHISVYRKIMMSIEDNVTKEELIEACPEIREQWKQRQSAS
ncbi:mRNA capping enzyme alpha subunit and guanylyltransferase [Gorgonomyces haynaldii]|nr:mRNA capping enzyme alpha subunit and guanylyltransferase [Gorgonomyces haynaldii]